MGYKKIIIPIVVAAAIVIGGITVYCITTAKASNPLSSTAGASDTNNNSSVSPTTSSSSTNTTSTNGLSTKVASTTNPNNSTSTTKAITSSTSNTNKVGTDNSSLNNNTSTTGTNTSNTGSTSVKNSSTTKKSSDNSNETSGITIGNPTSNSTLFSDSYQKLYYSICTGLNINSLPGPELVTNLDNYITINGENYYYVYTPIIDEYNMGGIPMDSANGNFSQIGTGEYVNAEGVALPKSDYSLIATATHSEDINNLNNSEITSQLSRITSEYINCYVAQGTVIKNGNCTGPYANMNNNVQTATVNLNDYKIFNGEKAYSVIVNSKDNTQLYVALNGYVYISTENEFANVSNAQHLTQKQWKQAIKGI